jgi:hypothetical protein
MVLLISFVLELSLIFVLSRFVTRSLSFFFFRLVKKEHIAVVLLAILFFPGTLLHELSHFFIAVVLFVRVGSMEFIPKIHGDSVKLGSVSIAKTDPFRRSLIGLAPLYIGITVILSSIYYFSHFPLAPWYLNILFVIGIVFEIGNTMFSSKRDVEGLPFVLLIMAVVVLGLYMMGVRMPQGVENYLSSEQFSVFARQICLFMLVPIGIDGGIILLMRMFANKTTYNW